MDFRGLILLATLVSANLKAKKENAWSLEINFDKRWMKIFIKDAFKMHKVSSNEVSTYWVEKNPNKYLSINLKFLKEFNFFIVKHIELC